MMRQFDDVIGLAALKAIHLNDSKTELVSHIYVPLYSREIVLCIDCDRADVWTDTRTLARAS
jgi:hypothetical protein